MRLDDSIVTRPKDLLRAFIMAADLGGLDDKQAAAGAGMDPATWSRFKQGDVGIKPLEMERYLDQCGNLLPLAFWAYRHGQNITPRESELEKQVRTQRERAETAEAENKLLRGLLTRSGT